MKTKKIKKTMVFKRYYIINIEKDSIYKKRIIKYFFFYMNAKWKIEEKGKIDINIDGLFFRVEISFFMKKKRLIHYLLVLLGKSVMNLKRF